MVRRVVLGLGALLIGLVPAGAGRADPPQRCTVAGTLSIVSDPLRIAAIPGDITFTGTGTCDRGGSTQPVQVTTPDPGHSDIPCGGTASATPGTTTLWFGMWSIVTIGTVSYKEDWESPESEAGLTDTSSLGGNSSTSVTPFPGASPFLVLHTYDPGPRTQVLTKSSAGMLRTPLNACKNFAWTNSGYAFTFSTSATAQFVFRG